MLGSSFRTCFFTLALSSISLPAGAEDDTATLQARKRWNEGVAAFDAGDYELARAAFAQVYALKPSPTVLRNLGEAEVAAGHHVDGANHLARFLREAEGLPADQREMVERSFTKAASVVGRIDLTTDLDGAKVFVDDVQVAVTPVDYPLFVEPGWREVRLAKNDRTVQRLIETTVGDAYPLDLPFDEADPTPSVATAGTVSSPPPSDASSWKLPVVISSGVLALAGVGAGGYFLVRANDLASDAETQRRDLGGSSLGSCAGSPDARCAALADTVADGRRAEHLAAGALVAGGALAVGTALAWWLWPERQRSEGPTTSVRVTPWSNPSSATWGGSLTGTF